MIDGPRILDLQRSGRPSQRNAAESKFVLILGSDPVLADPKSQRTPRLLAEPWRSDRTDSERRFDIGYMVVDSDAGRAGEEQSHRTEIGIH
jgi:hypothetical protein